MDEYPTQEGEAILQRNRVKLWRVGVLWLNVTLPIGH